MRKLMDYLKAQRPENQYVSREIVDLKSELAKTRQALSEITEINDMGIADWNNLKREVKRINKENAELKQALSEREAVAKEWEGVAFAHQRNAAKVHKRYEGIEEKMDDAQKQLSVSKDRIAKLEKGLQLERGRKLP